MKIIATYFDRKNKYRQLLKVFLATAAEHMPGVEVDLIKVRPPRKISRKHDMAHAFNLAAERAMQGRENAAVCDIDLMFVQSIESVFALDFDVAVTVREKYKYNTGLWFYRPTAKADIFLDTWIRNTHEMMQHPDQEENKSMIAEYAGIDQASLAQTISEKKRINVLELQCTVWNSCQGEWKHINKNTKVIHVKSGLRRIAMKKKMKPGEEYLIKHAEKWRSDL